MYAFEQTVYQIGGGTSEGTLMKPIEGKRKPEVRQYFERSGWTDVEFIKPRDFCDYLAKNYFEDGRQVFFEETNGHDYIVKTTSPHKGYEGEIFSVGILKYQGAN